MEVYNMAYAYNGSYISNITFNDGNVKQIINNANLESQDGFVFYAIDYQNNKDIDLMAYYLPTKGEGNHPYKWTISVKDIYSDGDENLILLMMSANVITHMAFTELTLLVNTLVV